MFHAYFLCVKCRSRSLQLLKQYLVEHEKEVKESIAKTSDSKEEGDGGDSKRMKI